MWELAGVPCFCHSRRKPQARGAGRTARAKGGHLESPAGKQLRYFFSLQKTKDFCRLLLGEFYARQVAFRTFCLERNYQRTKKLFVFFFSLSHIQLLFVSVINLNCLDFHNMEDYIIFGLGDFDSRTEASKALGNASKWVQKCDGKKWAGWVVSWSAGNWKSGWSESNLGILTHIPTVVTLMCIDRAESLTSK